MNPDSEFIQTLVCPATGQNLHLDAATSGPDDTPFLATADGKQRYPVKEGIPRFVAPENYADSFGYQWNKYAKLQLDSCNGTPFSRERFFSITEWDPEAMRGKKVLDAGCGAGRFSEVALTTGAEVTAMDLSQAVEACQRNLGESSNLNVVQASIYEMPFRPGSFDFAYCIGVIQHTPDPKRSVLEICKMVKPGGQVGLWIYERDWKSYLGTVGFKYLLRPWTMKMSRQQVEDFTNRLERLCWPINRFARRWGLPGKIIMRMLPVASAYLQDVPLSDKDFREWVRLDTFDMYSPAHDHPQKFPVVAGWLREAGFTEIKRHPHGGISITARRAA
jgi:2-polyprenyl-3-methyl-5-hydroxy-6-metoxy-1,4-benzoquinol methylase